MLDVPSALIFSFSYSSSSLRLRVSAREMSFLYRLRDMAPSDGHYAQAAPDIHQPRERRYGCVAALRLYSYRTEGETLSVDGD
jgi:hypothetical protein